MRIRKRPVPLPFSSVSPVPLSDPLFLTWGDLPPLQSTTNSYDVPEMPPEVEDSRDDDGKAIPSCGGGVEVASGHDNHSRAPVDAGRSTCGSSPLAGSTSLPHGARATGQRKKRLTSNSDADSNKNRIEKKTKASSRGNNSRRRGGEAVGGTVMKGSGCSRVNGRGWICGKETLVGFSLCEHHLSSARLRATKSVPHRSTVVNGTKALGEGDEKQEAQHHPTGSDPKSTFPNSLKEGSTISHDSETEENNDAGDTAFNRKRKMRSMSSLLGQVPYHDCCP